MAEMRTHLMRLVAVKPYHDWAKKCIGSVSTELLKYAATFIVLKLGNLE